MLSATNSSQACEALNLLGSRKKSTSKYAIRPPPNTNTNPTKFDNSSKSLEAAADE